MFDQIYTPLWNKYRPAIIQLMLTSQEGPKEYKLYGHEFKALNSKERNYSFELRVFKGKATNSIKGSVNASDLLSILNSSKKAVELMDETEFQFTLDKQFVLHVARIQATL